MFFNKEHNSTPTQTNQKSDFSDDKFLSAAIDSFDFKINDLKNAGVDLTKHIAQVQVVMDISGSMEENFNCGNVQRALTRILPAALRFDDNGSLEVFVFNKKCTKIKTPMTKFNYKNYVKTEILNNGFMPSGGTYYAPIFKETLPFAQKIEKKLKTPVFCIVITDGDNDDKDLTNTAIIKSSHYNIFYQFIGIGNRKFEYLLELDNLSGRAIDNTGFLEVDDINKMENDELYSELLKQYIVWLSMKNNL